MSDPIVRAITIDLSAMQAVVRALARSQARRSRTALTDLLDSLSIEAERLKTDDLTGEGEQAGAAGVLDAWIEDLKDEAMAA